MDPETEDHIVPVIDTTLHANDHNTKSPNRTKHNTVQREGHEIERGPTAQEFTGAHSQFAIDFYDSPATQPPPRGSAHTVNSIHTNTKSDTLNIAKSDFADNTDTTSRCFVLGGGNDLESCEQRAKTIIEGLGGNGIINAPMS
jgi:hypothetical protein